VDLVYTTSKDEHDHVELRYSIRSMYKYLQKFDKIFIVGEKPSWIKNVIYIPADDDHKFNAARNIYEKIRKACDHPDISTHFWYSADDSFLLKPLSNRGYPYFRSGSLQELIQGLSSKTSYYKVYVENTFAALLNRGLPTVNFDIHIPIIYHKEIYGCVMEQYDWDINKSYTSKTLYANTLRIPGRLLKDCKLHTSKTKPAIYRHIKDSRFFSTHCHAVNEYMKQVWEELYPEPSPVEF
jgi:hypothetical protein